MKKIITILASALVLSAVAFAQPKAVGVRGGLLNLGQISYEHWLGEPHFLEAELGVTSYKDNNVGFDITGLYNLTIYRPDWTVDGEWGLYVGVGGNLGAGYDSDASKSKAYISLAAQVGLEYTFDFPLQVSLDYRPYFFGLDGFRSSLALGIRYAFR